MTETTATVSGAVIEVPLNKLKKSPRNARKAPHGEAAIEALAASIGAKRMLNPLIVEPERNAAGEPTGAYLVTIGEGRRLAQKLRAKRGEIAKTAPIACVVETELDAGEISLDENVTRSAMHPADEFEAFRELSERQGYGPEEIAARFGVSPEVVRRRLRLGAVSPNLLTVYRDGGLTLDQLMAFAVSEDHARQEQVFEQMGEGRPPYAIRRLMTEAHVPAHDRRAVFVGLDAYIEAGGPVLRDLFTEDGGGWLEDVALLDRLATEKLAQLAVDLREAEGWKWAEAHLDYPHGHDFLRVYPSKVERTPEEAAEMAALGEEYDALTEQWADVEEIPPEVEARVAEIEAKLEAFGEPWAYRPEDMSRGGLIVCLGQDGEARIERGLIRPEDRPAPESEAVDGEAGAGSTDAAEADRDPEAASGGTDDEAVEAQAAPLSSALLAELTAYRTAGLREALAENTHAAFLVLVHALALKAFYGGAGASCSGVRLETAFLDQYAPELSGSPAGLRLAERHEAWARQMPQSASDLWGVVAGLDGDSLAALMAHCVGLSLNAVRSWERRQGAWDHAEALAAHLGLDMGVWWRPTSAAYFGRVTKGRIAEAVREAVSEEAAQRLAGLKKPEMAAEAERLVAPTGWLPEPLRTERAASEGEAADPAPLPEQIAAE